MAGEGEYTFWHSLTREVAYGQLPRTARIAKHRAVAGWTERVAGDRLTDHAELLAHHYDDAAAGWGGFGVVLEHGQALLGGGRCATRLGQATSRWLLQTTTRPRRLRGASPC